MNFDDLYPLTIAARAEMAQPLEKRSQLLMLQGQLSNLERRVRERVSDFGVFTNLICCFQIQEYTVIVSELASVPKGRVRGRQLGVCVCVYIYLVC